MNLKDLFKRFSKEKKDKTDYIVFIKDARVNKFDEYALIEAKDELEAKEIFGKNIMVKDQDFLTNYVYDRAVNMALPSIFFRDDKGHFLDGHGQYRKGLKGDYIQETFDKNIEKFFKGNNTYIALYKEFYYNRNNTKVHFPDDMILHIFVNGEYCELQIESIEKLNIFIE